MGRSHLKSLTWLRFAPSTVQLTSCYLHTVAFNTFCSFCSAEFVITNHTSEVRVCCAAQAAQEQQLQQPCLSFPTAAAWPRCKVLKPKSLRVQQCRAQGSEFLTWSQEWRRIWRCVFAPDFSLMQRTGKVVSGGVAVRTQEWRDSRQPFAFYSKLQFQFTDLENKLKKYGKRMLRLCRY